LPVALDGNAGDQHLDTNTGNVYEWDGNSWNLTGNIHGATGPQGPAGTSAKTAIYEVEINSSGYYGRLGFNKLLDEQPIVPQFDGQLNGFELVTPRSFSIAGDSRIFILKAGSAYSWTTALPPTPTDSSVLGYIDLTLSSPSASGLLWLTIKPGETVGFTSESGGTGIVSWTVGPAGNTFTRGTPIAIWGDLVGNGAVMSVMLTE